MSASAPGSAGDHHDRGRRLHPVILAGLVSGPFLSMIDTNVVTVAVPAIARQLHASLTAAQWTLSGYLLALAAALPVTGYLSRRYGALRAYRASLLAFVIASAACAAAPSIAALDVLRIR